MNTSAGATPIEMSRALKGSIALAVLFHVAAAFYNVGNFHPDGHFQILEFANYKLGNIDTSALPWEFFWYLRPATQPAIAYAIHNLVMLVGINDPFTVTFILRFMSATLGLSASLLLGLYSLRWLDSDRLRSWAIPACCLFWVLPFIHSSFMSENWAGSLLCLGALLIFKSCDGPTEGGWRFALVGGLLLGFSFYLRFPVGFAIAGLGLWVLLVGRPPGRCIRAMLAGFLVAIFANTLLDHWLYGEWVFTPIKYLESNIIHGKAAEFGVDPWWYYLPRLAGTLIPPWSLVLVPAIIVGAIRRPRNPLVWMFIPFIVLHSVIGHKETRFLIPVINLLPILVLLGLDSLRGRYRHWTAHFAGSRSGGILIALFVGFNIVLTIIVSVMPAHQSAVIQGWIIERGNSEPFVLNTYSRNPYEQAGLMMHYYKTPGVELNPVSTHAELCMEAGSGNGTVLVFIPEYNLPEVLEGPCLSWQRETSSLDSGPLAMLPESWLLDRNIWTIHLGEVAN